MVDHDRLNEMAPDMGAARREPYDATPGGPRNDRVAELPDVTLGAFGGSQAARDEWVARHFPQTTGSAS